MLKLNKVYNMDCRQGLSLLENNSVDMAITSPPYWGLRDYKTTQLVWDGDPLCEHEWGGDIIKSKGHPGVKTTLVGTQTAGLSKSANNYGNFCSKCGAWRGQLGLEPDFNLYVKHLCDIFDEVKRVLTPFGSCWVNLGDTYYGAKGKSSQAWSTSNQDRTTLQKSQHQICGKGETRPSDMPQDGVKPKSLLGIPDRFKIEMMSRGWVLRNEIIWWKRNCLPNSAQDRFTVDYEKIFFFVKSSDTQYWTNEKTLQLVTKQPQGVHGVEGMDWGWRQCQKCNGTGLSTRQGDEEECEYFGITPQQIAVHEGACSNCEGTGREQYPLWCGHDYYFEQQFEPLKEESKKRAMRGTGNNKNTTGRHLPEGMHANTLHQPRAYKGYEDIDGAIARGETPLNPNGRNKRCVWDITTQPFAEAHFAVFPDTLIETPIKAGCPEFVCKKCGMPRTKVYKQGERIQQHWAPGTQEKIQIAQGVHGDTSTLETGLKYTYNHVGDSDCGCGVGWRRGAVLDMFMGSGTTARKTRAMNRDFIGFELSTEYMSIILKQLAQHTIADYRITITEE